MYVFLFDDFVWIERSSIAVRGCPLHIIIKMVRLSAFHSKFIFHVSDMSKQLSGSATISEAVPTEYGSMFRTYFSMPL